VTQNAGDGTKFPQPKREKKESSWPEKLFVNARSYKGDFNVENRKGGEKHQRGKEMSYRGKGKAEKVKKVTLHRGGRVVIVGVLGKREVQK